MSSLNIQLKSIRDVQDFVRIVNDFPCEVDLKAGLYVVDAKSIMGILSLDLSKPVQLEIREPDSAVLADRLRSFIV